MKTHIAKRNFRSDPKAIKLISKKYGLAKVLKIGENYILEEFIDFKRIHPTLEQMSSLLKRIHSEKNEYNVPLVHGDFGPHNTTLINGKIKCFDYEYSHFGNIYSDIGRVLLRNCDNLKDINFFFNIYAETFPEMYKLKKGLIYFCNWQYELRKEKNLPYKEVPLIRAERIKKTKNSLNEIMDAFKSEVKIK